MKFKQILATSLALVTTIGPITNSAFAERTEFIGKDYADTSVLTARESAYQDIVVASAKNYPDALSAYNEAYNEGRKIVLYSSGMDMSIFDGKKVTLIGGPDTIDYNAENSIAKHAFSVKRVYGRDRYETNKNTIKTNDVIVADGRQSPDSMIATGYVKHTGANLMIVRGDRKFSTNKNVIATIGGKSSVKYPKGRVIAGKNRYETSKAVTKLISPTTVALATGSSFQDALSATNLNATPTIIRPNSPTSERNWLNGYSKIIVGKEALDIMSNNKVTVVEEITTTNNTTKIKDHNKLSNKEKMNLLLAGKKIKYDDYKSKEFSDVLSQITINYDGDSIYGPEYTASYDEKDYDRLFNEYIPQVIQEAGISESDDDYTKAVKLNIYIMTHYTYGRIGKYKGNTPFDFMIGGKAVCGGANSFFRAALWKMGIPAVKIDGKAKGGHHDNTEVYIDGVWMRMDATPSYTKYSEDSAKYNIRSFNSNDSLWVFKDHYESKTQRAKKTLIQIFNK